MASNEVRPPTVAIKPLPECQVWDCTASATYRVSNRRGESIMVCRPHMVRLRSEMVAPVVTVLS